MLRAITDETRWPRREELVHTSHPVVVLANTVGRDVLQALVVLKLRGFIPAVVLDVSTCLDAVPVFLDALRQEKPQGTPFFVSPGGLVAGYGSCRGLAVVSGLHKTVFASGLSTSQILDQLPELASPPQGQVGS